MINAINNVNFERRFHLNGYSKHTPKTKPYDEFYFMPELKKQNPVKRFFNKIVEDFKGIRDAMKPKKEECFQDIKLVNGSTTEI